MLLEGLQLNKNRLKLFFVSTILVLVLVFFDQVTKILAVNALSDGNSIVLIPNVLEFYFLKNTGAAFSFLTGHTWVFLLIVPIILLFIILIIKRIPLNNRFLPVRVILLFVIAGALGNYFDRILFGYVRDFIYFSLINFPIFNVADIYVTCSVILLIILSIFYYKDDEIEEIFYNSKKGNNNE